MRHQLRTAPNENNPDILTPPPHRGGPSRAVLTGKQTRLRARRPCALEFRHEMTGKET